MCVTVENQNMQEEGDKRHMHYVIQVSPGTEIKTEAKISEIVSPQLYSACFHPVRVRRKNSMGSGGIYVKSCCLAMSL